MKKKKVSRTKAAAKIVALRQAWEIGPDVLEKFQRHYSHDTVVGMNVLNQYIGFTLGLEAAEAALSGERATTRDTLYKMVYHPTKARP
jgi:hypothetical protein